jgi:cardiolipin synthase
MFMKLKRRIKFFIAVLSLAVFTAFIVFIFNPLGLGPEPMTVLPQSFFKMPAEDLNQLELLIGGEEAVEKIREEILGAGSSVYMQMFIWKDDDIGRRLVNALKSLAASGVKVTISKDILGSFFELRYIPLQD